MTTRIRIVGAFVQRPGGGGATLTIASACCGSSKRSKLNTSEVLAEREGFEPPIRLPVRRISSAVLSTTQPPLRGRRGREPPRRSAAMYPTESRETRAPSLVDFRTIQVWPKDPPAKNGYIDAGAAWPSVGRPSL